MAFVIVALLGFAFASSGVRTLVPWSDVYDLRAKMQAFEQAKDEIDAIYVGSSNVSRSYVPLVIDPAVEARSLGRFRSFNLGVDGGAGFETDHLLEEVLAMQPARLRWVVLEPFDGDPGFLSEATIQTPRTVRWHTPHRALLAVRASLIMNGPWEERLDLAWTHVRLAFWRAGNYGEGPFIVEDRLGILDAKRAAVQAQLAAERGYQALDDRTEEEFVQRHNRLMDHVPQYMAEVRAMSWPRRQVSLDDYLLDALVSQHAKLEAVGLEVIYAVAPKIGLISRLPSLVEGGHLPRLMDYHHPQDPEFRPFYRLDMHYDRGHLNRQGGEAFSRVFGRDLGAQLAASP